MRRLLVAASAAALLAAGAPIASAHPNFHYAGGCQMVAANDTTPAALLGGPTQWNGVMTAVAVATRNNGLPAPLAPIDATCCLYVNTILNLCTPPAFGTGVAVGASVVSFLADPNDIVDVCEYVTVNGESHTGCDTSTVTKSVPQPVVDALDSLLAPFDPTLCTVFGTLSPGIGPVVVGPDGDISVFGDLIYDCPPYVGNGGNVDRRVPYLMVNQ